MAAMEKHTLAEVPDGIIFPNYDFDKPQKLVFKYHEPIKHAPPNIPDSWVQKEQWLFYNKDVKVIKEKVSVHHFGKNLEYKEFEIRQNKLKKFINWLKYLKRSPEHGEYAGGLAENLPRLEKHVPGYDMEQAPLRPIVEEDWVSRFCLISRSLRKSRTSTVTCSFSTTSTDRKSTCPSSNSAKTKWYTASPNPKTGRYDKQDLDEPEEMVADFDYPDPDQMYAIKKRKHVPGAEDRKKRFGIEYGKTAVDFKR